MTRRIAFLFLTVCGALAAFASVALPAGAQQLVDAGGDNGAGGLAFVLMVVMFFAIFGSLFYLDHVRRNRLPRDDDTQ